MTPDEWTLLGVTDDAHDRIDRILNQSLTARATAGADLLYRAGLWRTQLANTPDAREELFVLRLRILTLLMGAKDDVARRVLS